MNMKKYKEPKEIEKLRRVMGTNPFDPKDVPDEIKYYISKGCSDLKVDLIAYPRNPYKQIFYAVTETWGEIRSDSKEKWNKVSPEYRFLIVKAALEGKTLPQALEGPEFQFRIIGAARSAFDQMARTRVGATFFSIGVRDNSAIDRYLIIHPKLYNNPETLEVIRKWWRETKDLYIKLVEGKRNSWQNARAILPMGLSHNYGASYNLLALLGLMGKRLKACEQHETVGIAWLMRKRIEEKFPMIASYMRPGCDWKRECQYYQSYSLSNLFGALFSPCFRNPVKDVDGNLVKKEEIYVEFPNESSADLKELEKELGFKIPGPTDFVTAEEFSDLVESDRMLFEEDAD